MDKIVKDKLNDQINKEFYSAYLYLDMANYYTDEGLDGFANWFRIQAMEERDHAMIFLQYLQDNGESVELFGIDKPAKKFGALMDPLKESLKHEKYVTALINAIYEAAFDVKDFRSMEFLNWFIKEQCEEEKNADDLIKKMERFGGDAKALYMLNSEMAARVYTPSAIADS